jgi:hypothetical protein
LKLKNKSKSYSCWKAVDLASKAISQQPAESSPHNSKYNSYNLDDKEDGFLQKQMFHMTLEKGGSWHRKD